MKKRLGLLMVFIVMLMAACGGGTSSESDSNGETSDAKEETSESGIEDKEMVSYTTDAGEEVEIPEDPQRIVILATSYFGNLMQMDANVVGVHERVTESEVLKPYTEDIELIEEGNVEQVMSLNPDLIIAFNSDQNLDKLKSVAPTIPIDYAKWNYLDIHKELADITGNQDKAEKWLEEWDSKTEEARQKVEEAVPEGATATVMEQFAKDIYVYGTNWGRGTEIIYQELDMEVPEATQEEVVETGWKKISAEEVEKYAGDYIFVGTGDSGADNAYRETEVWKNLDAVQNDQVIEFDSPTFYYNDPYSLEHELDVIVEELTKK
ncbi:ABC transporter substrate-binding protein [Salinicoccus siamensis]|uniref:ABC transporter substrate-binding protein n=1 Tax=Salinicoccus siamensis TaxID=381830 RepID=A0ABV5Z8A3_9STAP